MPLYQRRPIIPVWRFTYKETKLRKDFLKVTHVEGFVWLLSTMPHYVSDARYAHSTYEVKRKEIRGEYAGKITEWFQKNARSFDAKETQ